MREVIVIESWPEVAPEIAGRTIASRRLTARSWRRLLKPLEWGFGFLSVILGLSILAALPVAQFLCLGYFLESSARVVASGRMRDGIFGIRKAARVGGIVVGIWLSTLPLTLVSTLARAATLLDPGGPVARGWWSAAVVIAVLTFLHILAACMRGGLLRFFLWPIGGAIWAVKRLKHGGLYVEARDALWDFVASMRLPRYFRIGLVGYLGTLIWLAVPSLLIASGGRFAILGVLGALLMAFVVSFLPFLQVRYAVEGRARCFFSPRAVRERFLRAPWAFAFSLLVLLVAAIPLYLLKIEAVPRDAGWLPSLVFVMFLYPAHLLTGWAYARSSRREQPRHWVFRIFGRLAIVPTAILYVLVVFLAQYTSWTGTKSLFDQHAFLLPVPFLDY